MLELHDFYRHNLPVMVDAQSVVRVEATRIEQVKGGFRHSDPATLVHMGSGVTHLVFELSHEVDAALAYILED